MSELAILGGDPVRRAAFSRWPQYLPSDAVRLQQVLESGHWGGFPVPSPHAKEFAERFADLHGARYGLCIANGTIALIAALRAAGIRFGDEVIVPAYTWDGTATAVLFAGGIPVFADVDPDTYCLDVNSAASVITARTRAIIPVHLAMRFTVMSALAALAEKNQLKIIEDCAHAHGGQFEGRGAGSIGDLSCFSFQESKLMTAGEGGIVLTSNLAHFEHLQTQVNCGRASVTDQYQQRVLGSNYRMTEWQAAMLLGQLEMLPDLAEKRAARAKRLTEALASIDGVRPLPPQPGITRETIYCYVFQFHDPRISRDLFCAALEAEGIPCDGRFYEPVYRSDLFCASPDISPQLSNVDYAKVHCPVSERAAYEEAVWLPQFLLIGEHRDIDDIAAAIAKVLRHANDLASADPSLAGAKAMSRAQRPLKERAKNY
ncbi:MAG TPA: DegT/DnrJ/EryC1/StrS family aminotransferase [Bryobacteraceae bacterium]|jgi:dTDP-4-amino-4,6-dideoxygalactose transaminase|nr:DegT/DnrJ/EryC1/StrS family aminotransferase [Bryobacteraceae bacterium]